MAKEQSSNGTAASPGDDAFAAFDREARIVARPPGLWRWSRQGDRVPVRPPSLSYTVSERPPPGTLATMVVQHLIILSSYLSLPPLVAAAAGVSPTEAVDYLRLTLLGTGIATLAQCLTRGPVGSGYPVPALAAPIFFGASITACKVGGLDLVSGMTVFAGLLMVAIAGIVHRLRPMFPTEVTGVIVLMVAFSLIPNGFHSLLAGQPELVPAPRWAIWLVGGIAFTAMVVVTAMPGSIQRQGILAGSVIGIAIALALGVMRTDAGTVLDAVPLMAAPPWPEPFGLAFDWRLVVPFTVAAIASSAKTVGDLTIAQKALDAGWVRADMAPLRRGVLASALGNVVSGTLGGMGTGTATGCIGMMLATRVMSAIPAILVGLSLIALACLPKVAALFTLIPAPVMGAMVLFVAAFMIVSGITLTNSRMLNARRTLVVGVALSLGLGAQVDSALFGDVLPRELASGLTLSALAALALNLLLRIGSSVAGEVRVQLDGDILNQVSAGMERLGGDWGARRDVIQRVTQALTEVAEILADRGGITTLTFNLRFDEYAIDARTSFTGEAMPMPDTRPSIADILDVESGHGQLAGYLISRLSSRTAQRTNDGVTTLSLRFDH